ncbi:MAG: hypothetical protein IT243_05970 [Bacteroidia bacterium]|nr:hypothetical protein [Bacteroidia bacterium]
MIGYLKWFFKKGWKSYFISFTIMFILDYAMFKSVEDIINSPILIKWLMILTVASYNIGIIYHSTVKYRIYRDNK